MGLLNTDGAPMVWGTPENNRALQYVRDHGIKQLLLLYERYKDIKGCPFYWGDEIEHIIVKEDPATGHIKLSLRAAPVLEKLIANPVSNTTEAWRPEYGSFMIESVPGQPYTIDVKSFLSVETNMRARVNHINNVCEPGERGIMVVSFPLLGVGHFSTAPKEQNEVPYSDSLFIPDICINQTHPRFGNLTRNIRYRRGRKVCIQIPIFLDKYTIERSIDKTYNIDANPMNGAINCSADPATSDRKRTRIQAFDSDEEKDDEVDDEELARRKKEGPPKAAAQNPKGSNPVVPVAMTPKVFTEEEQGFFSHLYTPSSDYYYAQYGTNMTSMNVKQRYDACPCPVPSVDHPCIYMDCMAFGMGLSCLQVTMQLDNINEARHIYDQVVPLCPPMLALTSATPFQKGFLCDSDVRWVTISASVDDRKADEVPRIIKSRYDSVSMYISPQPEGLEQFNDNRVEIDQQYYEQIQAHGIDERLAKHFAHLFIRDPLVIYSSGVEQLDDASRSDHFENIQSTNWQTVRFKPPPYNSDIGWRVEFRVMEVQPTPFENAAFSCFVILFVKATQKYGNISYIPMSLVDQNMGRAHRRDPCNQTYHQRANIFADKITDMHVLEMTIDEIFNGKKLSNGGLYEGLVPLVRRYVKDANLSDPKIDKYLDFISRRASGELMTPANLFRKFVVEHPDYKQDSRLTQAIAKDFCSFVDHLAKTQAWPGYLPEELTGGKYQEFKLGQRWL